MPLPAVVTKPPFDVTRISHVVLTTRSLDAARRFYVDVLGFVASDQDGDALYLRGLEEGVHHSLVFVRSDAEPCCRAIGFRVLTEDDLDAAKDGATARTYRVAGSKLRIRAARCASPTARVR
jgi:catechol 2,3-dioxygenase